METKILNGEELLTLPQEPNNYLIEGMLWEDQVVMLLAKEKVGKSILALQMACALSCGEAFLGHYEVPEPMKVLYIQTESTRMETIERLKSMTSSGGVGWNPKNFHLLHTEYLALDTESGYNTLIGQINSVAIKPKAIFLDPLYMSMTGSLTDELSSRTMCMAIRRLAGFYKSAIVLPHHEHRQKYDKDHNKLEEGDNSIMGSFVWKSFVNHLLHLRLKKDLTRSLTCTTQRSARVIKDMDLELVTLPLHYSIVGTVDHPAYYDKIMDALAKHRKPACAKELEELSGLSESAVKKSLSYLHKTGKLKKDNPGRRPTYYTPVNGSVGVECTTHSLTAEN